MMKKLLSFLVSVSLALSTIPMFVSSAATADTAQNALDNLTITDATTKENIETAIGFTEGDAWTVPFYKKYSVSECKVTYPSGEATVKGSDGYIMGQVKFADNSVLTINKTISRAVETLDYAAEDVITDNDLEIDSDGFITALKDSGKTKKLLIIPATVNGIHRGAFNGTNPTATPTGSTAWADNTIETILFEDRDTSVNITKDSFSDVSVFSCMKNLKTVIFSEGQTDLGLRSKETNVAAGDPLFAGCHNLKYVKLSSKTKIIPDSCFKYCFNLETLVLPESIEAIGTYAFARTSLRDLTLPISMTYLGQNAFRQLFECSTTKYAPVVTILNNNNFFETGSGQSLIFENLGAGLTVRAAAGSYAEKYVKKDSSLGFTPTIPYNLKFEAYAPGLAETTAYLYAFLNNYDLSSTATATSLTDVLNAEKLNENVTVAIEDWEVGNGSVSFNLKTTLDGISMVSSAPFSYERKVVDIDAVQAALDTLTYDDNLAVATIENAVNDVLIGTGITMEWSIPLARKYSIPGCIVNYKDMDGNSKVATVPGADGYIVGQIKLSNGQTFDIDKTIPYATETYNYTTTITANELFCADDGSIADIEDSARTKEVLIVSKDVPAIYAECFNGYLDGSTKNWADNQIKCIIFEDRLSPATLQTGCFKYMKDLEVVVLCDAQTNLAIGGDDGTKGGEVFQGCENLKYVRLPKDVKNVVTGLFYNCTALEGVVLPNDYELMPHWALARVKLKEITLPATMKHLGIAFNHMPNLKTITILNGDMEFYEAGSREGDVWMHPFLNIPNTVVRVPAGSKAEEYIIEINEILAARNVAQVKYETYETFNLAETTVFLRRAVSGIAFDGNMTEKKLIAELERLSINSDVQISLEDFVVEASTFEKAGKVSFALTTAMNDDDFTEEFEIVLPQLVKESAPTTPDDPTTPNDPTTSGSDDSGKPVDTGVQNNINSIVMLMLLATAIMILVVKKRSVFDNK